MLHLFWFHCVRWVHDTSVYDTLRFATGGVSPSLMAPLQATQTSTRGGGSAGNRRSSSSASAPSGVTTAEAPSAGPQTGGEQHQPQLLCLPCLAEAGISSRDSSMASGSHRSESRDGSRGTVLFLHPDLERMEALARRLEADPQAALHGEALRHYQKSLNGLDRSWPCWVHSGAAVRTLLTSLAVRHWLMVRCAATSFQLHEAQCTFEAAVLQICLGLIKLFEAVSRIGPGNAIVEQVP